MAKRSTKPGRTPYRSPEGTYEMVLKSVLEDPATLGNVAFRVLMYLTTKPPGWVINEGQLARDFPIGPRDGHTWAQDALAELRAAGYVVVERQRDERGQFTRHVSRLRRDKVLAPPGAIHETLRTLDRITAGHAH